MDGSLLIAPDLLALPQRFLFHPPTRTAICSDLHLGAEAALARQGMYLPDVSTEKIAWGWEKLAAAGPARVILAGDVFDEPTPPAEAIAALRLLLGRLPEGCEVTVTPGNHDPAAGVLAELFPSITVTPAVAVGGYTVMHGHQSADGRGVGRGAWVGPRASPQQYWLPEGLIVGHQHPAVTLRTRVQSAKMICFICGALPSPKPKGAAIPLIILPTFSPLPLGTNLINDRRWILDLPRPADEDLRIAGIVKDQVLDFGPLSALAT